MTICAACNGRGKVGWRACTGCGGGGDSDRWGTAMHEAAHVEVAQALGATRVRAKLLGRPDRRGWGGWTSESDRTHCAAAVPARPAVKGDPKR